MVARSPRFVRTMLIGIVIALSVGAEAASAKAACGDVLPPTLTDAGSLASRAITPRDLLTLRDVGYPDPLLMGGPSPMAVSPDGREVAFVINRADPDANSYCRALVVMPVRPGARPVIADRGGELVTITDVQRGMFVRGGFPALVTPVWSPDGRSLAYAKRLDDSTQIWRAAADGSGARQVTHEPGDVEAVAWSDDGRLVFSTRPAIPAIKAAIDREGRSGWLYDARVVTFSGPRPQIRAADAPLESYSVDPDGSARRRASAAEAAALGPSGAAGLDGSLAARSAQGRRAWVDRKGFLSSSDSDLRARDASGRTLTCNAPICHGGIIGLWWSADGSELRYLRRQGWDNEQMALYRWRPGSGKPRTALVTLDALIGCVAAGDDLVCTSENATTPRRIVRINPRTGRTDLLFDPNPEFRHIVLGRVQRLRWRNDLGLEAWGDLVLPPGYTGDHKLPLIVVQYSSRGFLRGGTGDEYPIYVLAAHGFAVLSTERPAFVASLDPAVKTVDQFAAANQHDWADHRSLLSSLEQGVSLTERLGIVDPKRVGITGLSDGATTARFALINSHMFSAASISSCCLEPWTVNTYVGIAFAEFVQKLGFPSLIKPNPAFWKDMSIAQNASRLDTPLLMQLDDDDGYVMALEAFESLREYHQPVEMDVFPHEYHVKWQPIHRIAIYRRNLQWFDFWLRGVEDPAPVDSGQYARWEKLRAGREAKLRSDAAPVRPANAGTTSLHRPAS